MINREDLLPKSGIYLITNMISNKEYVGKAISFKIRWGQHKTELRSGYHKNPHLQSAWNLYGENSFVFEIVEIVDKGYMTNEEFSEHLIERESWWIRILDLKNRGYNILDPVVGRLGIPHTEEAKAKISAASVGNKHALGRKHTPEELVKMSAARKGVSRPPFSDDWKSKISASRTGKLVGEEHPMYGRKHTQEAKDKMIIAKMGNKNRLGHFHTEETRAKISTSLKGKPWSEARRAAQNKAKGLE